jgi:molybdenum cofactor cytidylyltransferase
MLILAAGEASRMGQAKQLLPWGETTLLGHVLEQVHPVEISRKYLLLGARSERILEEVDITGFIPVLNPEWEKGMGSGISYAVSTMMNDMPDLQGVMIVLADQPEVDAEMLRAMLRMHELSENDLLACSYQDKAGVPAIISGNFLNALKNLKGDKGARGLFRDHRDELTLFSSEVPLSDIDDMPTYRELHKKTFGKLPS